eukprot:632354-Amphidinium_carterae.1
MFARSSILIVVVVTREVCRLCCLKPSRSICTARHARSSAFSPYQVCVSYKLIHCSEGLRTGQWQPKPNGAETGHGEVPTDWAIELASENDRKLATFGWAGCCL